MVSKNTLATALAYIAITDTKRFLQLDTRIAANDFIEFNAKGPVVYNVTEEGMKLARTSKLWKAHECIARLGFEVRRDRKFRPAFISYRHPEQVETVHGKAWRTGFTGKHGELYVDTVNAEGKLTTERL